MIEFLLPFFAATALYTPNGFQALRLLVVSAAVFAYQQHIIVLGTFGLASVIQIVRIFLTSQIDIYILISTIQAIIGLLACSAAIYIKFVKKPHSQIQLISNVLITTSAMASSSFLMIVLFKQAATYFLGLCFSAGIVIYNIIDKSTSVAEDQTAGFGTNQSTTTQVGYFRTMMIASVAASYVVPLLVVINEGYYNIMDIVTIIISSSVFNAAFAVTKLMGHKKVQLRKLLIGKTEVQVENGANSQEKDLQESKQRKPAKASLVKFTIPDLLKVVGLCVAYSFGNMILQREFTVSILFAFTVLFSAVSFKVLTNQLNNQPAKLLALAVLSFKQPNIALMHFGFEILLNVQEKVQYQSQLMQATLVACVAFSRYSDYFLIFFGLFAFFAAMELQYFSQSNAGIKIQLFLYSTLQNVLIGLPRGNFINIFVSLLVLANSFTFCQSDHMKRLSQHQHTNFFVGQFGKVLLNLFNNFMILYGTLADQEEVLAKIAFWNSIIFSAMLLIVQFLVPLYVSISRKSIQFLFDIAFHVVTGAAIALTPCNITIQAITLFATGYNVSNQTLADVCYRLYFAQAESFKQFSVQSLLVLFQASCAAVMVTSLCIHVIKNNYVVSHREKELVRNNQLLLLVASLTCLYLSLPYVIKQEIGTNSANLFIIISMVVICLIQTVFSKTCQKWPTPIIFSFYIGLIGTICVLEFFLVSRMYSLILLCYSVVVHLFSQLVVGFIFAAISTILITHIEFSSTVLSLELIVTNFCLYQVIYVIQYLITKSQCIKRITKAVSVEHVSCKVNPDLNYENIKPNAKENNLATYKRLRIQMYIFVVISSIVFVSLNFNPIINFLISMATLIIPCDTKDIDGNVTQVAGYFGILEGWQMHLGNKLQIVNNYVVGLFLSLSLTAAAHFGHFARLWFSDDQVVWSADTRSVFADLVLTPLVVGTSFAGYVNTTGRPQKVFNFFEKLDRFWLMVVNCAVAVAVTVFATQAALKLMVVFPLAGLVFPAPVIAGSQPGKRIVHNSM